MQRVKVLLVTVFLFNRTSQEITSYEDKRRAYIKNITLSWKTYRGDKHLYREKQPGHIKQYD